MELTPLLHVGQKNEQAPEELPWQSLDPIFEFI